MKTTRNEKIGTKIANKVLSIFDNAELIQSVEIKISGEVGEAPLIDYHIKEVIVTNSEVTE